MNRISTLGKGFLAAALVALTPMAAVAIAFFADIDWLKGISLALSFMGLSCLLALALMRLTKQVLSVRKAVKQSYDRQLNLAKFVESQVKESISVATEQLSFMGTANDITKDSIHGYGVDFEYARRISQGNSPVNTYALSTRSLNIRDSLALAASKGAWKERDLLKFVRLEANNYLNDEDKRNHHRRLDSRNLGRFAGVLLNQRSHSTDLIDADLIYSYIVRHWGYRVMPRYDRLLAVEAELENRDYANVGGAFTRYGVAGESQQNHLFRANGIIRANSSEESLVNWVIQVNRIYEEAGFAPISLISELESKDLALYDRLDSDPDYSITDGPRVTILMPTFNADHRIHTAIRSLLKQTWQNFEILIVDDGSSDETGELLREISMLDDRIKLFFLGSNRGAYVARNFGLQHATGTYITVHDDDDWSHPQKIESQIRDLIENPDKIGNWSPHVRTMESLFFTRLNSNPIVTQNNFSSIMFKKELVDTLGGWHNVNRSGDSEFKERIETYSGQTLTSPVAAPMSFTRTGGASLTQGEMNRGYMDSARLFYMRAYQSAHQLAKVSSNWGPGGAAFPVGTPENLKDGQRRMPMGHFDVIYATDFRFPGGDSSLAVAEIKALVDVGKRVGLVQLDSPLSGGAAALSRDVLDLFENEREELLVLSLLDDATADLCIVRDPSVVQFGDQLETRITARNLILVVDSTPVLPGGTGQVYDLNDVKRNLERIFSVSPKIIPESLVTKSLLTMLGDGDLFEPGVWSGTVDTDRFKFLERTPVKNRLPVVGRHTRDSKLELPEDLATFRKVYVQPTVFKTRFLGGLGEIRTMLEETDVDALDVYDFGVLRPEDYLKDLDFWVYFGSNRLEESFGMGAAEAMASGVVVILPPSMRSTFGEAAVYCESHEVVSTIGEFWKSPERYREQATRAREICESEFSPRATISRMEKYADPAATR